MKELSKKGLRRKGGGAAIHEYLRDNHANSHMGTLSLLISYLKRLEGLKIGPVEAGLRAQELDRLYKLEEIHKLLPSLQRVLGGRRVVVLVDELDRGWDSSEDAIAFVAGLFQACVSINGLHPNLRVYVSLRQELYDDVPALYEDAQKHRDLLETIHWSEDSLLELIAKRIRYSAREQGYANDALERVDDAACWDAVFADSFTYMIDRTLYRPREIIEFCTGTLETARDRIEKLPLPYESIRRAEDRYSADRAKDIAAEYRFQYPGLLAVFEVFRGRGRTFGREELELLCLELATGDIPTRGTSSWVAAREPDTLIEVLWQVGFVTARPIGGDGTYFGVHQVQRLNLTAVQHFQVHPMFHAYLGLAGK
jgi:hypothetical protein